MKFIELCCLCSAVCRCRLLRRCSRWLISSRRSRSRGFFGVKSSPVRIYSRSLNSAFLCLLFCSICIRNRLKFTDSKHCFADDVWTSQLFMNTLVIDGKSLSVKCYMLPRNKKCAVTSNYCMTLWRTPSDRWALRVQLTRNHARSTHWGRRDYKLTSLGALRGNQPRFCQWALHEELFNTFARVIMNASQWLIALHLSHHGSKKTN